MWADSMNQLLLNSTNLIACLPLQRGQRTVIGHPLLAPFQQALEDGVAAMWAGGAVHKQSMVTDRACFQFYFLPTSETTGMLLAWDLSDLVHFLHRCRRSIFGVYRDVFYSSTGGKLVWVEPSDFAEYIGAYDREWQLSVSTPS
ncbi:MAG TPA: hypothetical protein VD902_03980, partial [Symbiobacteriaceae bacterium]|nr:hypothetical protein [Symbiobacteriaceae bacterium]